MTKAKRKGAAFSFLIKYRIPVLIIIIAAVAALSPGLMKLDITVSMENFFLEDDPVIKKQDEFRELFGNNDFIGVLYESEDVFSRDSLEQIRRIGLELQENVPFAGDITSIASNSNMLTGGARLRFKDGELQNTDDEILHVKDLFTSLPSVGERLFSNDLKQAWILLALEPYPEVGQWQGELNPQFTAGKAAWEITQRLETDNSKLTATGVPVYAYRKEVEMMDDLMRILIIGFITALAVSMFIIRNIQGVIGSVLVICASVAAVFGIEGMIGASINSALMAVPILLSTGVSIGYTVHISRFFVLRFRETGQRREAVLYALSQSARPILFTAFTTIAALLSFVFVRIQPIRWVGLTSAACILSVFLLSISLFPAVLSIGRNRQPNPAERKKTDWLEPVLRRFAAVIDRYPKPIILISAVVLVVAAAGISMLEVDFNAEKMMGDRLEHMRDQLYVGASDIAVSDSLDLVLKFKPDGLKDPEVLSRISELESGILTMEPVKQVSSLNSILRGFNYISHGFDSAYDTLPNTAPGLRGLLMYFSRLSPETLLSWCSEDYSSTRIFIELSNFSSREIVDVISQIEQLAGEVLSDEAEMYFSGSTYQMALMNQYVTRGLVKSIIISLATISCLMIIVFRSFRIGLAAMIPNIFPVVIAGSVMGFLGVPLEFVTMTIAPMIMGLAVDDTIHLIFHLKNAMQDSDDYSRIIADTFKTVGSAITETTIILCITFLVFTASRINSIINMGVISFAGMMAAYLSDIFITPVIIRRLLPSGLTGGSSSKAEQPSAHINGN